jgi:hypothetical protein
MSWVERWLAQDLPTGKTKTPYTGRGICWLSSEGLIFHEEPQLEVDEAEEVEEKINRVK